MKIKYLNLYLFAICFVTTLGCASGVRGINVTEALRDDPDFSPDFMTHNDHVKNVRLGGEYELLHDMWLLGGATRKNRYTLSAIGKDVNILPKNREAFEQRPSRYRHIVVGVVDKGTFLRSARVEYFRPSIHGLSFGGIVFQVQSGTHKGKYILALGDIILPPGARRFEGQPNPEFLREIAPPYLNAAGLPLNTSKTSTDE